MRLLAVLAALLLAGTARAAPKVLAVNIDGVVHPITAEIVARAIEQARSGSTELLLIRLNTPGGLMEATREVVEAIVASPVAVVSYVTPSGGRAASAGFFILQAADIAAMAPGTRTGAATPVAMGAEMDPVMRKKVENDAAAFLRSVADKRGRNSALAEKAVLESKSFTDKEALDNKLVDLIAASEADLIEKIDGREITRFDGRKQVLKLRGATIADYEMTIREKIVSAIADPNLALILLVLGALGIYVEFSAPGLIVPGVAGAILALLGLAGLSLLPINWLGAGLLVLAFALFLLEANFATHGILAIGGTVAMIVGALLLIRSPLPEMRVSPATAIGITLPFALITTFLLSLVVRSRRHKVATGAAGMIQELGVAYTPLTPNGKGKVFVHGEYWDAISTAPVEAGARVRVKDIQGLVLTVEPAQKNHAD
jgi:membrane-bound serine protease (ClpP class)